MGRGMTFRRQALDAQHEGVVFVLAAAPTTPTTTPHAAPVWFPTQFPSHWPGQNDIVSWCAKIGPAESAVLILMGIVYMLWGIKIFRILVMLNAAVLGAYLGAALGEKSRDPIPCAVIGAFTAAAISFPLMKYMVAVMGGAFGAILGATIWRIMSPHNADLTWLGAIIGLICFGALSLAVFHGCVMMYTSLQGAVMLIFGILGLIFQYRDTVQIIPAQLYTRPFILPAAIFISMLIGLTYQQATPAGSAAPVAKK